MKTVFTLLMGFLIGAAAVVGGYLVLSSQKSREELLILTFTEAEIQERLARKFPKEEKVLGFIKIVIDEPAVAFLGNDNRIQLATRARIIIPLVGTEEIGAAFSSSIRYQQEDHTLRTADYQVEDLDTDRLPEEYESTVRAVITAAARELLHDEVIHTVKDEDVEGKLTRLFLQELKVKKGELEVVLGF